GLDSERKQLAREERPVQVGPVATDELTAGDDDYGPRACQAAGGAFRIAFGVTSSCIGFTPPGISRTRPFTCATRLRGFAAANQIRLNRNGRFVNARSEPCCSVPSKSVRPDAEPPRTSSQESPFVAVRISFAIGALVRWCFFTCTTGGG